MLPPVTWFTIAVPEELLFSVRVPSRVPNTPFVSVKELVTFVGPPISTPLLLSITNLEIVFDPAKYCASDPAIFNVDPEPPLIIVPELKIAPSIAKVVLSVIVMVLPEGICNAPTTVKFPPVENEVEFEVLSSTNILSLLKLAGLPPVPSGYKDQLVVLLNDAVEPDFT